MLRQIFRLDVLLVGLAVILVGSFVLRYSPEDRRRVHRTFYLFLFFFISEVVEHSLRTASSTVWAGRFDLVSQLLTAYLLVNVIALAVFDLLLPALKIRLVTLTSDILMGVAYIVSTVAVMRRMGMDLTSVLAASTILSAVLAVSLQTTFGNILGGVALQLDGSFHVDDWLQLADGRQGKVTEIRWRHTVLETRDWDTIIVPNSLLLASQIIILGKREGQPIRKHRMTFHFHVDWRFTPTQVIDLVNEALRASPLAGIADSPPPHCLLADMASSGRDSFGYYLVRYWLVEIDRDDPAQSLVRNRVYAALRRGSIPLARPSTTVFHTALSDESAEVRSRRKERQRQEALGALHLFDSLDVEARAKMADQLRFAPFLKGEVIAKAGSQAQWLYILMSGVVEVRTAAERGETHVVAVIEAPDFFGEMGLLTGEARSADVVATTDVELFRLDKFTFESTLRAHPEVAEQISTVLAHRRVDLMAVREGLDAQAKLSREDNEKNQILSRIRGFFGLGRS